ncbi:MAG: hypothetical protein WA030_01365 [Candidatus Microsaccharimonas sp.]
MAFPEVEIIGPPTEQELAEAKRARGSVASLYIEGLDDTERQMTLNRADELFKQGGFLPRMVAITPIAAHQEQPPTILQALSQYARQKDAGDFSIILGLNYPPEEMGSPQIARNYDAISKAKKRYPRLDIRVLEECYGDFTMGTVRRDLWNAALALSDRRTAEVGFQETLGMTHDIDLVTMSPHFLYAARGFHTSTQRYDFLDMTAYAEGRARPFRSRSKHAYDPRFPNIGRATVWSDAISLRSGGAFEAGTFFPFTYYAKQGGYDPELIIAETHELYDRSGTQYSPEFIAYSGFDNAFTETSNRRYIQELQTHGLDGVWTEDNFTNRDEYRSSVDGFTDISKDALRTIVKGNIIGSVEKLMTRSTSNVLNGRLSPDSPDRAALLVKQELLFVERLVGETLDLRELTYFIRSVFSERIKGARDYHLDRLAKLEEARPFVEKLVQGVLDDAATAHEGAKDIRNT